MGGAAAVGFIRWIEQRVPAPTNAREISAANFAARDEPSAT
jgi:hypothetical protein